MMKTAFALTFAAILTISTAKAETRDPDKIASMLAMVAVYDDKCEKIPDKVMDKMEPMLEYVGKAKVVGAMMRIEDVIRKSGQREWCAKVKEIFGPLLRGEKP
jgi:hypothetical protein